MNTAIETRVALVAMMALVLGGMSTLSAHAVAGTNAADVEVTVEARQGGEWFDARRTNASEDGVISFEDALPGKYRFDIADEDLTTGQSLGVKVRMLDEDGTELDEESDVDIYVHLGDQKVFAGTTQTDDEGDLELEGILHNVTYEVDVKDDGDLSAKDSTRVMMYAKIDDSDWFKASTKRLEDNTVLRVENVLPGKYKFKYKNKDKDTAPQSFVLNARLRDEEGKKLKKATKVKLYAYPYGVKTFVAEIKTDKKGWITVPGVQTHMKYKVKVD
jgi:hypothetical protein